MAYTKQTWIDDNAAYPVSAARMGVIEQGVFDAAATADQGHRILTTAQKTALGTVTTGTQVYDSTLGQQQVYTGSAWVPVGGLQWINTTPVSAQSTLTISNIFSATYDNYRIVWTLAGSGAANDSLNMRLTTGGTPNNTSGNYYYAATGLTAANAANNVASSTTASAFDFFNISATGGGQGISWADVFNPFAAQRTGIAGGFGVFMAAASTTFSMRQGTGQMTVATSYDGIQLFPSTGGVTMTGTIRVYGYVNS